VLRHLIVQMPKAHTTPSPMMREEKSKSMMGEGRPVEATEPGRIEPGRIERPVA
jgi:small subunit ribosomal protein S6